MKAELELIRIMPCLVSKKIVILRSQVLWSLQTGQGGGGGRHDPAPHLEEVLRVREEELQANQGATAPKQSQQLVGAIRPVNPQEGSPLCVQELLGSLEHRRSPKGQSLCRQSPGPRSDPP